jgi:hypothetical protein
LSTRVGRVAAEQVIDQAEPAPERVTVDAGRRGLTRS